MLLEGILTSRSLYYNEIDLWKLVLESMFFDSNKFMSLAVTILLKLFSYYLLSKASSEHHHPFRNW